MGNEAVQERLFDLTATGIRARHGSEDQGYEGFGARLKRFRERYGIKRSDITRLTGISDSGLSRIENMSDRFPNQTNLVLLITAVARLSGQDLYEVARSFLPTEVRYNQFVDGYRQMRSLFVQDDR